MSGKGLSVSVKGLSVSVKGLGVTVKGFGMSLLRMLHGSRVGRIPRIKLLF